MVITGRDNSDPTTTGERTTNPVSRALITRITEAVEISRTGTDSITTINTTTDSEIVEVEDSTIVAAVGDAVGTEEADFSTTNRTSGTSGIAETSEIGEVLRATDTATEVTLPIL